MAASRHSHLYFFWFLTIYRIHVSREARSRLVELGGYHLTEKGQVQIKGEA